MQIVKRVDRLAFAVRDLDEARSFFETVFGAEFEPVEDVEDFEFRYQPFSIAGSKMELICPSARTSPVSRFLMKRQEGFHHVDFEVEDLDEAIAELKRKGVHTVSRHDYDSQTTFEGLHWREAFIHPKDSFGILIHLVEKRLS